MDILILCVAMLLGGEQTVFAQQPLSEKTGAVASQAYKSKGYVVSYEGAALDKQGKLTGQILLSVSKLSGTPNDSNTVLILLEAYSVTAKNEISKPNVTLQNLIYSSVQYVAESVIKMKSVKTKKAFGKSFLNYKRTVKNANDLVAIHGYQIVEDSYDFQGGKTVKI